METGGTVMTQGQFEEWCGSHQVKGCGKTRTMCEDSCRPMAQTHRESIRLGLKPNLRGRYKPLLQVKADLGMTFN